MKSDFHKNIYQKIPLSLKYWIEKIYIEVKINGNFNDISFINVALIVIKKSARIEARINADWTKNKPNLKMILNVRDVIQKKINEKIQCWQKLW